MAEGHEVSFRVVTGNLNPTKVTVEIRVADGHTIEANCFQALYNWYTIQKVPLPKERLTYRYRIEKNERSWLLKKRPIEYVETENRSLPSSINNCRDVFKAPHTTLPDIAVYSGLENLLQRLLDSIGISCSDMKQIFNELEHMWPAVETYISPPVTSTKLKIWLQHSMGLYTNYPDKVAFLCVMYGKLTESFEIDLRYASPSVTKSDVKKILDILEHLDYKVLTNWCYHPLRIAVKNLLQVVDKAHWLYLAANFHQLFTPDDLKDVRLEFSGAIDLVTMEKVVIPKVLENLEKDDAAEILNEIPNCVKPSDRTQITEILKTFTSASQGTHHAQKPSWLSLDGTKQKPVGCWPSETPTVQKNVVATTIGTKPAITSKNETAGATSLPTSGYPDQVSNEAAQSSSGPKACVTFYVLVREKDTTQVKILLSTPNQELISKHDMKINIVKADDTWVYAKTSLYLHLHQEYNYHFSVTKNTWAFFGVDTANIEETFKRTVTFSKDVHAHDTFQFPDNSGQNETNRIGKFLYIDMFLNSVSSSNLKETIIQVEKIDFPGKDDKLLIEETCKWMQNQAFLSRVSVASSLSETQFKFLAVILAKLIRSADKHRVDPRWFTGNFLKHIIDSLQVSTPDEFPSSVRTVDLEYVCIFLIHSCHGNWLHAWDFFFEILGSDAQSIDLLLRRQFLDPPKLVWGTWHDEDCKVAERAIRKLGCNKTAIEILTTRLIANAKDTRVINGILVLYQESEVDESKQVNKAASARLNQMIESKYWTQNLSRLEEVWLIISQTNMQVADTVRVHIIKYLRNETWRVSDVYLIRRLLLIKAIYSTAEDFFGVMQNLLKQQERVFACDIFIKVLQSSELMTLLTPQSMLELITQAIELCQPSAYFANNRKQAEAIRHVYEVVAIICQCEHFDQHNLKKDVKNVAYKTTTGVSLETLLNALSSEKTKSFRSEEVSCLAEHIQRRLREDKKTKPGVHHISCLQYSSGGDLVVASTHIRDILVAMIETQTIPAQTNECEESVTKLESAASKIFQNDAFWLIIFQSTGPFSIDLKQHPHSQQIAEILQLEVNMVSTGRVTTSFLKKLKQKETKKLLDLMAAMSPTYQHDIQQWKQDLRRLTEMENTFIEHLTYLREFFDGCLHRLSNTVQVNDIKTLTKELKRLVKDSENNTCLTLYETTQPEYWGLLFQLIPTAVELHRLSYSTIFLNICSSVLTNTCPDILETSEKLEDKTDINKIAPSTQKDVSVDTLPIESTEHEVIDLILPSVLNKEPISTMALARLLLQHCFPIFKRHIRAILYGNMSVSVGVIENMMSGVVKEIGLSEEIKKLETFFDTEVPKQMKNSLKSVIELPLLTQRSKQLATIFVTFDIPEEKDDIQNALKKVHRLSHSVMTLIELHEALKAVTIIETHFEEEEWEIVEQLAESKELITFLRSVIDEDLRNLIDAVEERSEQSVDESTVSDLIDVKRYMQPLLKVQRADELVIEIRNNRDLARSVKKIPNKLDACVCNVHSLKDLYNNVANRGEMTKGIITNALQEGVYSFQLDYISEECRVVLSYKRGKSEAKYGLNELNDIRSRALLIINTQKSSQEQPQENLYSGSPTLNLTEFVNCITTVNDIVDLCSWLLDSGHFHFRDYCENVYGLPQLQGLKTVLQRKYDFWQGVLDEARQRYYFLNFFHSKQLWQLDQFFTGEIAMTEDLRLLFQYVHSGVQVDTSLRHMYEKPLDMKDIRARLFHLGESLHRIFDDHPPVARKIPGNIELPKSTIKNTVYRGSVFVAELDIDSSKSIPVLLRLYKNTTGYIPEPYQVVFCHADTSWEEIYLLLQRCIGASNNLSSNNLYTLVNVELLSLDTQFELVKEMKKIQESGQKDYLLAIICRGGNYHHIIDQFSPNFTHRILGLSDAEMRSFLRTGWSDVEVLTSSQPGLGKSEYVKNKANRGAVGVSTMTVSGPVTKEYLVKQIQQQQIQSYEILHIDAAPMSDSGLFDSFFFEIVVTGMAVSGTHMCMVPTTNIVLELANTQEDTLRNALTTISFFNSKHLKWAGFQNYIISTHINSSVQVVCHYLRLLDCHSLDSSDIVLTGPSKNIQPLKASDCRHLLEKFIGSTEGLSFTVIDTFLCIFAQELRRMSASLYFTTKNLKDMLSTNDVRSQFVKALLEVSKEFSSRSIQRSSPEAGFDHTTSVSVQTYRNSNTVTATKMVDRVQGMVKWADSNHLLIVFHRQDSQTISPLYRLKRQVPAKIKKLFETQMKRNLTDYKNKPQEELQKILEKIVRNRRTAFIRSNLKELQTNYALTPDNLLKMVLIHMRIKSCIPVIIMGETGCGKTTLITYLARVCEIPFNILNLHAGVTEEAILNFIESLQDIAEKNLKQEVWGFFDEINTCDHLGLLNEVICRHSCKGTVLPHNLVFIAACNPYRLKKSFILSAGLKGMVQRDEQSKLVYRVHPLPESMMDYVWDFGSLDRNDEDSYIRRMLEAKDLDKTLIDLVVMSQDFMRDTEKTSYCVSLRDVNRCQHLTRWFEQMLVTKKVANVPGKHQIFRNIKIRSIILALAHCYHSRLTKESDRAKYRKKVATIVAKKKKVVVGEIDIERMIRSEQLDLLNRMQLPPGTAKNEALRENVFVILVSILNSLPVFVVGKPGCSKSLSMQLIRSNLRGLDSKDSFFKKLPPVYVISHQGSESSTSEGIIKVFEKAKNYKKANPDVMPIVLLDEIGLAEVSSFNPLKVLHSQLEPTVGGFPPVAVVGISNWALDAAKMNRAIHLSRPEPTVQDLALTAMSIRDECARGKTGASIHHHIVNDERLRSLAEAYSDYQLHQIHKNFHGLRDYYSLVKYIAIRSIEHMNGEPGELIQTGLLRNFGGLKLEMTHIIKTFSDKVDIIHNPEAPPTVQDLIRSNLDDTHARHLMLITSGDSALNILEQTLKGRDYVTIFGSRFENDICEEYNYRILSEIILCMERGVILILRDLENIYGSLYDMLNQNYTIIGKKRNCRVALGAYSNPMCQVHDKFRCIVLVDEQNVDYQNPPFLNRFEKQTLRFSDILTTEQQMTIEYLRQWVVDISFVEGFQCSAEGMFLGLHDDTLPSVVYLRSSETESEDMVNPSDLANQCKIELMKVACPDAVLRISKSKWAKEHYTKVEEFQRTYFSQPQFDGIKHFLETQLIPLTSDLQPETEANLKPVLAHNCDRLVIYTHSSIHTDVSQCLRGILLNVQIEKLSTFKSERHLASQLRQFWLESDKELLIIQCLTSVDSEHMLLAKCNIDLYRQVYLSSIGSEGTCKHACIIVHIDREETGKADPYPWQFNFLCGWQQVSLETLEPTTPTLLDFLDGSISSHLAKRTVEPEIIIEELLPWCFSCIKYDSHFREVKDVMMLAGNIAKSHTFKASLQKHVLKFIQARETASFGTLMTAQTTWQVAVATDKDLLLRCSTLVEALIEHIKQCVKEPLAKCIVLLESHNAWASSPRSVNVDEDTVEFWQACFDHSRVFDIESKDFPQKLDIETCLIENRFLDLKFPFFNVFHEKIEGNRAWLMRQDDAIDGTSDLENQRRLRHVRNLSDQLTDIIQTMHELQYEDYICSHADDYCNDLINTFSVEYAPTLDSSIRLKVLKWFMMQLRLPNPRLELGPVQIVANTYANLWTNAELFAAGLQLISIYKDVSGGDFEMLLTNTTSKYSQNTAENSKHSVIEETEEQTTRQSESLQKARNMEPAHGMSMMDTKDKNLLSSLTARDEHPSRSIAEGDEMKGAVAMTGIPDSEEKWHCVGVSQITSSEELLEEQTDTLADISLQKIDLHLDDTSSNGDISSEWDCEKQFHTLLVSEICKSMLPFKDTLQRSGGIKRWHQKASLVIILAGRVSVDSSILHFLRLCRDFATLIFNDYEITEEQLDGLSKLAEGVADPLSAEKVLDFVINVIRNLVSEEVNCQRIERLEEFLCIYFGLCLEVDLDTPLLSRIVQELHKESGELICGSRPVLLEILKSDIEGEERDENSLPVCEQIIRTGEFDEDVFPNLALIHKILLESDRDCHLAAVCCDIVEKVAFKYVTSAEISTITSDDHPVLKTATEAIRVIHETNKCTMRLVIAVAYHRAFIDATAELFHVRTSKEFKIGGKNFVFANVLNGLLWIASDTTTENNVSPTKLYLLKRLRAHKALYQLQQWCDEMAGSLTALYEIKWQTPLLSSRLGYSPLAYVAHYTDAIDAIRVMQDNHDKGKLVAFFTLAKADPEYRIALLAALADLFYLVQATGGTKVSNKDDSQWIYDQTDGYLYEFREFCKRLLGLSDFCGILKLDESTSQRELETASVVLHLMSIAVSYADKEARPILLMLMSQPTASSVGYLPCVGKTSSVMRNIREGCLKTSACPCGMIVVKQHTQLQQCDVHRCPICDKKCTEENLTQTDTCLPTDDKKGYVFQDCKTEPSTTESVRSMSPVAYRVLDVILHGCYLAGQSSGLLTNEQLVALFSLEDDDDTHAAKPAILTQLPISTKGTLASEETLDLNATKEELSSNKASVKAQNKSTDLDKAQRYVIKRLQRDWRLLRDITFSRYEGVTLLLHSVLRACTKYLVSAKQLESVEDRNQWEKSLSKLIDQEVEALPNGRAQYKCICLANQNIPLSCLEAQIEELDSSNATSFRRLLRNRHNQSFIDFKARFCTYSPDVRCTIYPFLQLCLERHDLIELIRHLPALLRWNKYIANTLSHNIKRKDANQTKIAAILYDDQIHPNEATRTSASEVFEEFQQAWNSVLDSWILLTGEKPEFDIVTCESAISDFVVDSSKKQNHLRTMIKTLQAVQNNFLLDTLAIASRGSCPSLNFLVTGSKMAGLKAVHLTNARDTIIEYEWSDNILIYSDINTEYGYGSEVNYNFSIIERELARRLVLNKAILTEGDAFTQFAYSDDLCHTCSTILTEINDSIQQKKLSKELVNTITNEQNLRPTFAKYLLERIEVIMVLLKKTGGDPESSLDDYIKRWSNHLPGYFPDDILPDPRDSIKLHHVAHLYEILEDQLVGAVILSLNYNYRQPLPDHAEGKLVEELKTCTIETLIELAELIQRFVFRYLRSGADAAVRSSSLVKLMERSVGNTMDCSKASQLIPEELAVAHIVKILEVINKYVKLLKEAAHQKDIPRPQKRGGKKRRGGIMAVS